MATIQKEITIDAAPDAVWSAVRDVGAVHERLVPGLVVATTLDGDVRTVTFANGMVVREQIVTIDDGARRLVYAASGGRTTHHNSSLQVVADGPERTRLVWITDLLPAEAAGPVGALVEQGAAIMKATLERDTREMSADTERNAPSDERVVPATKGVTTTLLGTVDLGAEIEGMAGRQLRMRMVIIEPGGVFGPVHDHKGRPGIVYILQGTITDHRNGVATDYGPGLGWPEDRNTLHWLENRGTIPAVEISVDIVRQT